MNLEITYWLSYDEDVFFPWCGTTVGINEPQLQIGTAPTGEFIDIANPPQGGSGITSTNPKIDIVITKPSKAMKTSTNEVMLQSLKRIETLLISIDGKIAATL